jgi:hypothetical protein
MKQTSSFWGSEMITQPNTSIGVFFLCSRNDNNLCFFFLANETKKGNLIIKRSWNQQSTKRPWSFSPFTSSFASSLLFLSGQSIEVFRMRIFLMIFGKASKLLKKQTSTPKKCTVKTHNFTNGIALIKQVVPQHNPRKHEAFRIVCTFLQSN